MVRVQLRGKTESELEEFAESIGEPRYRGRQLFDWLYRKESASFAEMTSFSGELREKLASVASIEPLTIAASNRSPHDGTVKYLFDLGGGTMIESVLIPPASAFESPDGSDASDRLTLCVSTQAGCPLDCAFCATASMGFTRNLTSEEIVGQALGVKSQSDRRITNVVFMGMGEPLMNYDAVLKSADIFSRGMHIAARRITISTAGWIPGIVRMGEEKRRFKLAVSLHSLDQSRRQELMPVAKKYPLTDLLGAVREYYSRTKLRVTFEYILFDGFNDSDDAAAKLVELSKRIPCKFNLIPFHDISFVSAAAANLRPASRERIDRFAEMLREEHATVFVRSSAGDDINAACGQLAVLAT